MPRLVDFYGPHMMGREYGYRPAAGEWNPYTKKYHRGQDIRQLSAFGNYSVTCDVLSLSAGRVVAHQRTGQLGVVVVVDTGRARGRYEAHSHMADPVPVGTYVNAGDRIARTAGHGEVTGSAWTAPHDHLTIGDSLDVAHNTWAPEYDPRPFIADALSQPAGAGGKLRPFPIEEEEMSALMLKIKLGNGTFHQALLAPGVFSHLMPADKPDFIRDAAEADWVEADLPWLAALLRAYGCDKNIWDVRGGKFVVLDPLTGVVGQGNTWTASKAIRAELRGIATPQIDTTAIVEAVRVAIEAGRDYDAAAIAKAVNDDAAKRLAS